MASRSSNRTEVPEAKEALDRFKMEVAGELGWFRYPRVITET